MDPNSPRYEIVKDMEEPENNTEDLDRLTEAKNSKNRNETDNLDVAEDDEDDENNTDTVNKDRTGIGLINKTSENSGDGAANNNDNNKVENNNMSKDDAEVSKEDSNKETAGDKTNGRKPGDDDIVVLVAGKDDVDAASTYSLFMEKDFRYYFQHPFCRLFIAYFVVFCNFLIYAEDPVAHSRKECLIPMIGNDFAFVCTRYPPNAWSLLKVVFWLIGLIVGMFIGKLLVHGLLFSKYEIFTFL